MYKFSIIIPYYNKKAEIDMELMSISLQEYNKNECEVIIVDDGSIESIEDLLIKYENQIDIKYYYLKHTGNRAANRNVGIGKSSGDRIIMLDSDMVFEKDLITQFDIATRNNRKSVSLGTRVNLNSYDKSMVAPQMLKENFEIIKSLPSWKDERTINIVLKEKYGVEYEGYWQLFFSHCLCMWRCEFDEVGGFDERFGENWGAEDIELGYRLFLNGCKIELNTNVCCYHIFHPVNLKKNILSLIKNYSIFLKKHRNWQVEIFIKEYQLWAVDANYIISKIKEKTFLINQLKNSKESLRLLPEKVLLVGVEDTNLMNSEKVEAAFIPESSVKNDKIKNIIGFELEYPDKYYDMAIVSENYKKINYGLFIQLMKEINRVSKKSITVNDKTDLLDTLINGKKVFKHNKEKNLLVTLSNENTLDFDRNNFLNLALAAEEIGIKVGIQHAFDPFKAIEFNKGFLWMSNVEKRERVRGLGEHQFNFMSDEVPNIINVNYLGSSVRSLNRKIAWIETVFINEEQYFNEIINESNVVLFRRLWELNSYNGSKAKYQLPIGIDTKKIKSIKNIRKKRDNEFIFLCTDNLFNAFSNIDVLVEVFQNIYKKDRAVQLRIISPGEYYLSKEIAEMFSSKGFKHLMYSAENRSIAEQKAYIERIKTITENDENIKIYEKNMSDEEFSNEIKNCDCFIHLNSGKVVFPPVLEAIAFGKKVIIPNDNRYDGYLSNDWCYKVETNKISSMFLVNNIWPIHESVQPLYHYVLSNAITRDGLEKAFKNINKNRDSCIIPEKYSESFMQAYDWCVIAEKLNGILFK